MKISFGYDHGAYHLSEIVSSFLESLGHSTNFYGPTTDASSDYPDFAHPVAEDVLSQKADFGILICGSGNGMAISANKHPGIRAGLAWSPEIARLARYHNDANILCLPARFIDENTIQDCIKVFLETPFEGGRHCGRVAKIDIHP